MMHRIKKENDVHKGKWNGIGGKVHSGETPEECVVREVYEETGLRIIKPKLAGRILFPAFGMQPKDWHVYVFTVNEFSGELSQSSEGVVEWIDNNNLLDLNLWEGDKLFLKWIEKGKYFSAKIIYDGNKLKDYKVVFHSFK